MNEIVQLEPSRLSISRDLGAKYEVTPDQWRVLIDNVFPNANSPHAVLNALSYCKARGLDIFKRPVHIVPMWSSAAGRMVETVWPGISELRTTAARTGEYAGLDETAFGPAQTKTFTGRKKVQGKWIDHTETVTFPEWASVTVYRFVRGKRCAFHAKVFWLEAYATAGKSELPNDMWTRRTYGQLDKCAEAAALRKAFPEEIGNDMTADEMEGRTIDHDPTAAVEAAPKIAARLAEQAQGAREGFTGADVDAETAKVGNGAPVAAEAVSQTGPLEEPDIPDVLKRTSDPVGEALGEPPIDEMFPDVDAEEIFPGDVPVENVADWDESDTETR